MTSIQEIIAQIREAFIDRQPPTQIVDKLFERDRPFEVNYIRQVFGKHSWQELSQQTLLESASMLIYMTNEAYCYYTTNAHKLLEPNVHDTTPLFCLRPLTPQPPYSRLPQEQGGAKLPSSIKEPLYLG